MSARVTRQSKRIASLSATATPVSNLSPSTFSSGPASIVTEAETPITSEEEDVALVLSTRTKAVKTTTRSTSVGVKARGKKRLAESEVEDLEDSDDEPIVRPSKRRAVSSHFFVDIPGRNTATKGKSKV